MKIGNTARASSESKSLAANARGSPPNFSKSSAANSARCCSRRNSREYSQRELPEADALVRELQDFRVEFTAAGNLTFNARQGRHDDLVLALAIAAWRAYGPVGRGMNIFELYRREAAKLAGADEPSKMVVGVDLGQAHDPTAIAVVRRVPIWRIEELPDPPPPPLRRSAVPTTYAIGSVEYAEQQKARLGAASSAEEIDPWLPPAA
jgi:hypothetical protein